MERWCAPSEGSHCSRHRPRVSLRGQWTLLRRFLEFLKLDDVVGAVPAHLFAGIWGTLAVCIASGGDFVAQLTGVLAIGAFTFGVSIAVWAALDRMIGARVSAEVEDLGQDAAELGIEAYPEFVLMPDQDDVDALSGSDVGGPPSR